MPFSRIPPRPAPDPAGLSRPSPSRVPRSSPSDGKRDRELTDALGGGPETVPAWGPPRQDEREEREARAQETHGAGPAFDLSRVRLHADKEADAYAGQLGTAAFTYGRDIYLRHAVRPGSALGQRVLQHELMHVAQQERSGVPAIQCYSDQEILAELEQNVTAEDTKAQRQRLERLKTLFNSFGLTEADNLLKRLMAREPGDKIAAAFYYRLSTPSREQLLAILQRRAVTVPITEYHRPTDDPKYIDNVIESTQCALLVADRYTLVWQGGRITVFNPEIDWTGKSKALPVIDIHPSKAEAQAAASAWRDVPGYDTVVGYYRADAGVIVPTWISPETAPITYDLIMGVNAQVRSEAAAAYDFFRSLRNGMIVGFALGAAMRVVGYVWFGGGGRAPIADVPTEPAGGRTPAAPVEPPVTEPPAAGTRTPAGKPGTAEPAGPVAEPAKPAAETAKPGGQPAASGATPAGKGKGPTAQAPEPAGPAAEPAKPAAEPAKAGGEPTASKPTTAGKGKGSTAKTPAKEGQAKAQERVEIGSYRSCFVAGTLVATPAGHISIETLRAEQVVLARPDGAGPGSYPIGATSAGWSESLYEIGVAGASLRCTPNHRFWVVGRGWVPAHRLLEGDRLETLTGDHPHVERVATGQRAGRVPTYELRIPVADSYFVVAGSVAIRVHNNGLTDPSAYNRVLYWIFGKKAKLRPGDVDGLSAWRTNSFDDVRTFQETRVNLDGRIEVHAYYTQEQLDAAGIKAPVTPGEGTLTGKLPHHSLRPASAPDYPAELTAENMEALEGMLRSEAMKPTAMHPRDFKC